LSAQTGQHQNTDYLVETDWLEQHLNDTNLRVYDCSVSVQANPDLEQSKQFPFVYKNANAQFEQGHIPRAGFIDIPGVLSDLSSDLPLMLPPEKQFIEAMSRYGVGDDTRVVLYSTTEPNWSARVWWMLRAFGFDNAVILNGGWNKWIKEGRAISNQACEYSPGQFTSYHRPGTFVSKDRVLAAIDDDGTRIVNALPSLLHSGASEIVFGRKGRIAGSVNVSFTSLHDPVTGCYLPADELQKKFDEVDAGNAKRIINYCGGGIASSNNAFALTLLGYENVTVYDGSLLEWGNDTSLPMEADLAVARQ